MSSTDKPSDSEDHFVKYMQQGKDLGLVEDKLAAYVDRRLQQDIEREDRALARNKAQTERMKIESDRIAEEKKLETERLKIESERIENERKAESERLKAESEEKIAIAKIESEAALERLKVDSERERLKEESERLKVESEREIERLKVESERERLKEETERLKVESERETERLKMVSEEKILLAKEQTIRAQIEEETRARAAIDREETIARTSLELSREETERRRISPGGSGQANKAARYPKMPYFDENKDDIDSYLFRFEAFAKNLKWEREEWAMFLGVHLKGTALALFHSLSATGNVSFEVLKRALLIKFQCTKDGYRDKFKASKPETEESFLSFATRIVHLFDRWIDMSGIKKTYDGLKDLFLCEHLLSAVSKDLSVFLRERDLKTSKDMMTAAEQYRLAHPHKCLARRVDVGSVGFQSPSTAQTFHARSNKQGGFGNRPQNPQQARPQQTRPPYTPRPWRPSFPQSTQAPRLSFDQSRGAQSVRRPGNRGGPRGRGGERSSVQAQHCMECGGLGHFYRECPTYRKKMDQRTNFASVSVAEPESVNTEILCSCTSSAHVSLPICEGTVNGFQVSVLRDSGATTAGVRKALVRPDQYLGKTQEVVSFGGNLEKFPLAEIDVDTSYFSGPLICCVIQEPVADLILGNVVGVAPIPGLIMSDSSHIAAAVETRSQKKQTEQKSCLDVPFQDLNLSKKELITLQEQDPELQTCRDMAVSGRCVNLKKSSFSFSKDQGVLMRNFSKEKVQVSQIVVPAQARKKVLFTAHDGLLAGHCGMRKTIARVENRFWWPGIGRDVRYYCKTCDVCQKCVPKGRTPDVPLSQMPRIDIPFQRVAIDIVGPFSPLSEEKHRYLLTIVDVATRFPEAIPLKTIDSVTVADALFSVFLQIGISCGGVV